MSNIPKISDAEWLIMQQLWENSPLSANDIVKNLEQSTTWNPKTIKTLINRLVQKEAIGFEKEGRSYLYYPLVEEQQMTREESRNFLNRFFGGTLTPMLANLIENKDISEAEVKELKDMLDKAFKEEK